MAGNGTGSADDADGSVRNGSHPRHRFSICAICGLETHTGLGFAEAGTPTSAGGGYVYLRNRWYDPQTGRFLSQDPIGLAGGVNLYAYAGNNPASYSDPFGLCPPEDPTTGCTLQDLGKQVSAKTKGLRDLEPVMLAVANVPLFGAGEAAPIALKLTAPLASRAKQIQAAAGIARAGRTTTAVASAVREDGSVVRVVGTSEGRLRAGQVAALEGGKVAATGARGIHAEANAVAFARAQGWRVAAVAASRPVCGSCAELLDGIGALITSVLK